MRAAAWFVLWFAVAVLVTIIPVQRLLGRDVDDRITSSLADDVEEVRARAVALDGEASEAEVLRAFLAEHVPADGEVVLAFHAGAVLGGVPQAIADELLDEQLRVRWSTVTDTEWGTVARNTGEYRWVAVRVGDLGAVVVAADVGAARNEVTTVVWLVAGAAAVALVAASALAWLLRPPPARAARSTARPVSIAPIPVVEASEPDPAAVETDRLRLIGAAELTALLGDIIREQVGERRWHLAGTATGDLVCDPWRLRDAVLDLARYVVARTRPDDVIEVGSRDEHDAVTFTVSGRDAARTANGDAAPRVVAHDGRFSMETDAAGRPVFAYTVPRRPPGDG